MNTLNKFSITLTAIYPLAAFFGLWIEQPLFIIGYLVVLLSSVSIIQFFSRKWLTGSITLLCIAIIFYAVQQSFTQYLIYLPPILIFFSLFALFSQSLLAEGTPLIGQYAKMLGNKTDEKHLHYYKVLTILWSGFFLLMAIISIILAAFSSVETWSLFTHVISYFLVAGFFLAEFTYRKKYFSGEEHGSFLFFMRKIIKTRPHTLSK